MVRFSQNFWDKEANGTSGYDTLIRHLKDGRRFCDTFSEFLKQRAKTEDDYGKGLMRLAQQAGLGEKMGTLAEAWKTLKKETETMGSYHCELSKKLDEVDKRVKEFREEQKGERTKLDDKMKRLQKEKRTAHENVIKTKKQYEQRCKELDSLSEALDSVAVFTPKEEEKMKNRRGRAKTSQENADQQYQTSVKGLELIHDAWEQEMVVTCDRFQELEEQRIRFLRNEMWVFSNIASQSCVDDDSMLENVRLELESCDEYRDIATFVHHKQSGSEKPPRLKYENYYHPTGSIGVTAESNTTDKMFSSGRNSHPFYVNNMTPAPPDEGDYAAIQPCEKSTSNSPSVMLVAAFDYDSQGDEELTLRAGDLIELLGYEDQEWGRGILHRSGRIGVFPLTFVHKR